MLVVQMGEFRNETNTIEAMEIYRRAFIVVARMLNWAMHFLNACAYVLIGEYQ